MRTHRWIPVFTLAAALSLAACGGEGNGKATLESNDGLSPTTGSERAPGPGEGGQSGGSPSAQERTTVANDTAPHRPGTPGKPGLGNQP
ncbi:MAG TPA: hypothetical protein VF665_08380 [Longimicrobium sp.]|jgi:hypothetical protein|uniref:hypothetical protein n=1 Tax=Longimicrobium sp. TaxID=2029185 RepID=UPI002EDB340A